MRTLLLSSTFKEDLDSLDPTIRKKVICTLRDIERDPHHSGLRTEKQHTIRGRKIQRSRVNQKYRMLWEWIDGSIGLWHVGNHEYIDGIDSIRAIETVEWTEDVTTRERQPAFDIKAESQEDLPFQNFPSNILRILGVPDEHLDEVRQISGFDAIWDIPLPKNVQATLGEILTNPRWSEEDLLNPRRFLYRTNLDMLEGYTKGKIKKLLLNLTPEQEKLVKAQTRGAMLVKGVAGSGKTTIGIYRAHALLEELLLQPMLVTDEPEGQQILVLTYTTTLANALQQMFIELYGELPEAVVISHYDKWLREFLETQGEYFTPPKNTTRIRFVEQAIKRVQASYPDDDVILTRDPDFFLDEFDAILYGRGIFTLKDYRQIRRVGRGSGLQQHHREIVWQVFSEYKRILWNEHSSKDSRYLDYGAVPMRIIHQYAQQLPRYKAVIVDEAQDLPPVRLRLAAMLTGETAQGMDGLTLLADPAQSIYYRGIPWKEGNIQLQGGNRTRILERNFRNTVQILKAAERILDQCEDLKDENEYISPQTTGRLGPRPILAQYRDPEDALAYVSDTVITLCQKHRYRLSDIAIVMRMRKHPTTGRKLMQEYAEQLENNHIPVTRYDNKASFDLFHESVKLITMHSAKGLEFPVVFIVELDADTMPYISSPEKAEEDSRQERKLLYVSMTRASERLFVLYPKTDRSPFIRDLVDEQEEVVVSIQI